MAIDSPAEILRLRTALRDLVALSVIPAAWVGREPPAIAAGLADVLVGSLHLDFAFVRLCDPNGGAAVEVTRGNAWIAFPESLERHLTVGQLSRKEFIPDVGGGVEPCRGIVIPVGVNAEGGLVAAACDRTDFPTEIDQLLLSVAANHAATAFQSARLIHERRRAEEELRQARNELEMKVAERTTELRQATAELQTILDASPVGIALFGRDHTVQRCNPAFERILGWSADEIAECPIPVPAAHQEQWSALVQRLNRGEAFAHVETRFLRKDGSEFDAAVACAPLQDEAGRAGGFVGTIQDISDRKRAEEERQAHLWFLESMDKVNLALQGTNDPEQMMSDVLDGVLSIFNGDRAWLVYPCDPEVPSWRALMEHTRPEFPGCFALGCDLPVDEDIARVFQAARAVSGPVRFGPGANHPAPAQLMERFGVQSLLAMAVYPKVDKPYLFGLHQCSYPRVWTPQEERFFQAIGRRLEDALTSLLMFRNLRESEAKLEKAQRIAQVGYWERDLDTDLITWSDETYRIFGLSLQERTINFAGVQELIHPEDRQIVVRALAEALRGGLRYDAEYRVVRPDGGVRFVHSQSDVTRDEAGQPRRMFGTVQDITERKEAEAQLTQITQELIARNQELWRLQGEMGRVEPLAALGRVTGTIAHELGTPLNSVLGYTQLLAQETLPEGARESLQIIETQTQRMIEIIQQYLSHTRRALPRHRPLDLNALVRETLVLLKPIFHQGRVQVQTALAAALPFPSGDGASLQRVLINVLTNAVDAMESGGEVSVTTQLSAGAEQGRGGIVVKVQDTGNGIAPELLPRLFDLFVTTKAPGKGTGLGLAVCQEIMKAHGGTITIASQPRAGTCVRLFLPTNAGREAPALAKERV